MGINRIILLAAISGLLLGFLVYWPDNKHRVVFCDVGQGDGILIYKGFNQFLIDVGPDNKRIFTCLQKHMPFWDKKIEGIIVTHWDADHVGSLPELLKHYRVEKLYAYNIMDKIKGQINYSGNLCKNDTIKFGLISFDVLSPESCEENKEESNQESIVGILSYKDIKILLMADATLEIEQGLVWRKELVVGVDILKLGHHGSETATSEELLNVTQPKLAVISVGKNNRFGHPSQDVIERLKKYNVTIKRTDEDGSIFFSLD